MSATKDGQLDLLGSARPFSAREKALAGTLAGYVWPGHQSLDRLPKKRQQAALEAARATLDILARVP